MNRAGPFHAHNQQKGTTLTETAWTPYTTYHVDPRTLILEGNSRDLTDLEANSPEFVASVHKWGVQQPINANTTPDGQLHVRSGFSRSLAAISAVDVHPTIPVYVVPSDNDEAARLVHQVTENDQRTNYTTAERAANYERLSLFGLTGEQIAQQLSTSTDTIEAGLRVRGSRSAVQVLDENPQLDMLQAAVFAEFDDDEDAIEELTHLLEEEPEQFDHVVSRLRRDRAAQQARDELADQLRADGVTVITDHRPDPDTTLALHRLSQSSTDGTSLDTDVEHHAANCAGHAAWVYTRMFGSEPTAAYMCQNWRDHGHVDRLAFIGGSTSNKGPKSEREKLERRRVLTNNKAWRAAVEVRRKFLTDLLRRKEPPKQAQQFVAAELIEGDYELRRAMERGGHFAVELLNLSRLSDLASRKPTANQAILNQLAVVLCAIEGSTDVDTWRRPVPAQKRYFAALQNWGYSLAPVERLVLDPQADAADWPGLHDASASEDVESDNELDEDEDELDDEDEFNDEEDETDEAEDHDQEEQAADSEQDEATKVDETEDATEVSDDHTD